MTEPKLNKIAKFARFFIKNYQVSILVIIFLIIGGITGYLQLPRQGMPEVEVPYSIITAFYPGATPKQVETEVTRKIEDALDGIEGIKEMESSSMESVSTVFLTLESDIDLDEAVDKVRREVDSITDLPKDVEKPEVMKINAQGPDLLINIVGETNKQELSDYAKLYQSEISKVDGVEKVELWSDAEEEININLNLAELNKTGITYEQIKQAIAASNLSMPGGTLEIDDDNLPIQIDSRLNRIDDVKNIQIGFSPFSGAVTLDDVADVERTDVLEEDIYVTGYVVDNKMRVSETVTVAVSVKSTEDVIKVTEDVNAQIEELENKKIPENIKVVTVYEVAKDVKGLLGDLFNNAWQGLIAILVVLVIFISFRSSIISAFIIPLVLLTSFLVFTIIDLSLNFITLYALILSLGIVIDNAIVIVEGVQRNILEGQNKLEASINAVQDLGPALIAATATTVLVFIPMMFLGGMTGEFIKYIPYTVVITLIGSIVIAFSLTPFMSRIILSKNIIKQKSKKANWVTDKCILGFCRLVNFILKSKYRILIAFIIVAVLISGSGFLASQLKVNIWPEVDDAEFFQVSMTYPKNSSQDYKIEKIKQMTDAVVGLYDNNDLIKENVVSFAPFSFYMEGMVEDQSMFIVNLVDDKEMTAKNKKILSIFQEKLDGIEGVDIKAENFSQGPPSAEYPIEVQIANEDGKILEAAALDLAQYLKEMDGVKKVDDGISQEKTPQISVTLDREKVGNSGLAPFQVAGMIRSMYNPEKVIEFRDEEKDETLDIKLGFAEENSLDDLKDLQIGAKKLSDIATVEEQNLLKKINHFDKKRYVEVKVSLEDGIEAAEINKKIEEYFTEDKLKGLNLESNAISYRGDMESETQAFDDFGMLMAVSLIAIYALLTFQFKSFAQPFIIMLAIPLAIIGVFPGLYITNSPISFMAMLGMVVLMGIVVNNSIILIDRFNKLRARGDLDLRGAITEGVSQRTRPIFATTLTTIAGILPLTITEYYWRGMGTTIIAGLVASSVFVLIIIPVVYYLYIALLVKTKDKTVRRDKAGKK